MEIADERDSELVLEMIASAMLAGAYRRAAREMPECRSGWEKMARRHSIRVAALADQIVAAVPFGIETAAQAGTTRHAHG